MQIKSRIAMGCAAVLVAAASPLHAQQQPEPLLHEQIIDGVRGLLNKLFGGSGDSSGSQPAAPEAPRAEPVPVAPVATQPPRAELGAVPSPAALTLSRSLHEAVVRGDLDSTQKMLDQGIDIETKDPGSGASPLHYAVMKGRMEIVDLLLARGADVNSRTRNGTTPLHTAALYSRKEVAERLIEKRADLNAVSASGATPLALAAAAKNHSIADMLRTRGAK